MGGISLNIYLDLFLTFARVGACPPSPPAGRGRRLASSLPTGAPPAQQRPQGAGTHQAANAAGSSLGQTGCLFFGRIHKRAKRFTNVLFIEDVEKGHMNLSCCCLAQGDFPYIPLCVKQRVSEYR